MVWVCGVSGAIVHGSYSTDQVEDGAAYLQRMYVGQGMDLRDDPRVGFRLSAEHLQVGNVFIAHVAHTVPVLFSAPDGLEWQAIVSSSAAGVEVQTEGQRFPLERSGAVSFAQHQAYTASWHGRVQGVGLDTDRLHDLATTRLDAGQPLEFAFDTAVSPVASAHWLRTVDLVRRVALANAHSSNGALLADELSLLVTEAALVCFANPTHRHPDQSPKPAGPASLRRAVAFIDTHLDQPLSLADIAAAARVSPRALAQTFRRHLEDSPMAYVRRARLDRAHHDLTAARPGDGQTVTAIAARWGFYDLPRFGVTYRKVYGRPPSHTLRRD